MRSVPVAPWCQQGSAAARVPNWPASSARFAALGSLEAPKDEASGATMSVRTAAP